MGVDPPEHLEAPEHRVAQRDLGARARHAVAQNGLKPEARAGLHPLRGLAKVLAVDVDRLASQVKRASELIAVCREKISTAKLEVDKVVADLKAD